MGFPYLITFKPYDRFYFGTTQSFGESFYAISSIFPTQTTILGTLRATILKQNDLLDLQTRKPKTDSSGNLLEKVKELTGTSKMIDLFDNDDNFGKILKISPVFIVKQGKGSQCIDDVLFPVPADVVFEYDNYEDKEKVSPEIVGLKLLDFKEQKIDGMKVYSRNGNSEKLFSLDKRVKDYTADYFGGISFWQSYSKCKSSQDKLDYHKTYLACEIFFRDSQPGIARENRKTKEEHFYVKNDFRMADEYSFGVIVHFSEENVIQNCDVIMGGEKSLFGLSVKKIDTSKYIYSNHPIIKRFIDEKDFGDLYSLTNNKFKLVALSPIIGNDCEIGGLNFAIINEMYIHRNIEFDGSSRKKDTSYSAIPYGSVLFVNNNFGVNLSKVPPIPRKIGFNFLMSVN